jgi:hypothetical protein
VKLWSAESLELIKSYQGHKSAVTQCAFTPDEKHLVSVASDELIVWYVTPQAGVASARLMIVGLKVRQCQLHAAPVVEDRSYS